MRNYSCRWWRDLTLISYFNNNLETHIWLWYIYTYIYTCVFTHIHVYIYTYIYMIFTQTVKYYIYVRIYIYTHIIFTQIVVWDIYTYIYKCIYDLFATDWVLWLRLQWHHAHLVQLNNQQEASRDFLNALCALVFRTTIRCVLVLTAISSGYSLDYDTVGAFISSTPSLV